jgi:hypothetical protein
MTQEIEIIIDEPIVLTLGAQQALPDSIVLDENYVHTDNNYTDADKNKVANALTSETDPTVPSWAKQPSKPSYNKSEIGLGNVDNTSDANKPISTATQTVLNTKADKTYVDNELSQKADSSSLPAAIKANETLTAINGLSLTGNILTISYTGENGVTQTKNVDLSSLTTTDVKVSNAAYNAATNIITITNSDASTFNIDLSEFSIIASTDGNGVTTLVQEGVTKATISRVGQTGDYNDLTNKPTLGTASAQNSTAFATAAQGVKADTALQSETDPTVPAHVKAITTTDIENWNSTAPHSHDNKAVLDSITAPKVAGWDAALQVESDPIFNAHTVKNITNGTGFLKNNGSGVWNYDSNSYSPLIHTHDFTSLTGRPTTLTGYGITDAIANSHVVNAITGGNITNWNTAFANSHTHANQTALDAVTTAKINNWDAALQVGDLAGLATENYVDTKVAGIVDAAPETLNTLNELAAALGDDPNFATTVATQIGQKANTADLGTAAAQDSTAFATAAQGAKADTALQSETDPTVPAYAKTLTDFSIIKTDTDPLYKSISYTPSWNDITSKPNIPEQVNIIQGSNIVLSGTYPNITISSTGSSGGGGDVVSVTGEGSVEVDNTDITNPIVKLTTATETKITNAVTAYLWGDHSTEGYLKDFTETDPTVPAWAKQPTKPSYSKSEIGLGNVDNTSDANKPVSTAVQNELNLKANTLDLSDVATTGSYNDLSDKPTIPTVPVQSVSGKTGDVTLVKADILDLLNASQTVAGLMSETDKARLDALHALMEESSSNDVVDTINEILLIFNNYPEGVELLTTLAGKVDKIAGKGLSENDYTDADKTKLSGIEVGAQVNTVNSVAGKTGDVVLNKADVGLSNVNDTSDLSKPISTATQSALNAKQDTLFSGTNIKTVNSQSLLGSGDIEINSLPSQASKNGKFLKTDGSVASWESISYSELTDKPNIPTKTSDLTNDSNFLTSHQDITGKEDKSNKITTWGTPTDTQYPSAKLTKDTLDTKQATITGAATTITSSNLTTNRAVVSDGSGKIAISAVNSTELGYLSGVSSSVQTQLNGKQDSLGFTPENSTNKATNLTSPDNTKYPTTKAVSDAIAAISIPVVNDAILTIQKNGVAIDTFTANSATNKTVNIIVPTKTSDITNDSGFLTSHQDIAGKEDKSNKVTSFSSPTDTQYPSAKLVNDQLAAKQVTITGAATTITSSNLTTNRALVSDGSGKVTVSSVTSTELGYLSGVSSAIQTQLNGKISLTALSATTPLSYNNGTGAFSISKADGSTNGYLSSTDWTTFNNKQATINGAATTITSSNLTNDRALISNGSGKVDVSTVTSTELGYISGVTSSIQTQLNSKQASIGFTPENVTNKKTTLTDNSDTFYPTQKAVKTAVDAKQDTLVSGTNIKTINGTSVLGSGNLTVDGLPAQAGKNGKYLKTDGTNASWEDAAGGSDEVYVGSSTPTGDEIVWIDPTGAADTLGSYSNNLTSDVQMPTSNSWYDAASIALPIGTFLINAQFTAMRNATTALTYFARLTNKTTHYASSQAYQTSVSGNSVNIFLTAVVTLASATTIYLQGAASSGAATVLIKAALSANGSGNNATQMTAIKL